MAHFAEIDEDNVVIRVLVVPDEEEHRGQEFLADDLGLGGRWIKTSYNTKKGIHYDLGTNEPSEDQSKAFRKNYAGVGFIYDEERDAFIQQKPIENPSFILNEDSGWWEPPIPMPETGEWYWDEETVSWKEFTELEE